MLIRKSVARSLLGAVVAVAALTDVAIVAAHAALPPAARLAWTLCALALQMAVLALCVRHAVRLVARPLGQLAAAADGLGPDLKALPLAEDGPAELADAARAFNAMQQRVAGYMAERIEVLAAISHDLQTPITRMRLRAELMADEREQAKFLRDLDAMNALVREGLVYARTLHGTAEPPRRVDARALLESMVADYGDAGRTVLLEGWIDQPIVTRPHALRRILANLIDNALKFASEVRVRVHADAHQLVVAVLDNGPGISPDKLEAVFKPFYRIERACDRAGAGTGLGLAIALQLAKAMGGELKLRNRAEGGLEARLALATPAALPCHAGAPAGLHGVAAEAIAPAARAAARVDA
ncbi:ATP-binding protein [Cupriavidus sp. 30B13]|uniref:ATP-binding protein n=1 Tax=Cupriavidus sp. 30B13 TaxID=3384241 RepID=UPI003B8EB938